MNSLIEQAERRAASGDFEQADALFQAAVAADATAAARIAYGVYLFEHERFEAAEIHLREGWDAARRARCRIGRVIACSNLAVLYLTTGDMTQATQFEQLALSAWFEIQSDEWSSDPARSLATLPIWLRRMAASRWFASGEDEAAAQLLTCDRTCAPQDGEGWFDAGALAERLGDINRALVAFDKSLEAASRCSDAYGEAVCLERLAGIWRKSGHWRRADRALETAERIHDRCQRFHARYRCQTARAALASPLLAMNSDPGLN